jgi:hypothetical protein
VIADDFDKDGDLDVVSAAYNDDTISWYENTNGQGSFGQPQIITDEANRVESISSADIDLDGDMDIIAISDYDMISWYENLDGGGTFGTEINIAEVGSRYVCSFTVADIDSDGDMDILAVTKDDDMILIYENLTKMIDVSEKLAGEKPNQSELYLNYPNPFNPKTTISFSVKQKSPVMLNVYDITGRRLKTLVDKTMSPGNYKVQLDGTDLPSGIYLYQIKMGGFQKTRKMTLLK